MILLRCIQIYNSKMELKFQLNNSISHIFLFLSLLLFTIYILLWNKSKQSKKVKLPPGPWKLPFIGSLHHLLLSSSSLPHHTLTNLSNKYGPLMHLQLGEISTVVVSSPETAKAITKTHDIAFANRPKLKTLDIVFYDSTDIAFSPYGDYWRQMRKICVMELLSAKMVRSFESIRHEELSRLVSSMMSSSDSYINLTERVSRLMSSTISKAAFGTSCREEDQERFVVLLKGLLEHGGFDFVDLFPSLKWIACIFGTNNTMLLTLHRELDKIFEFIIDEHKEKIANGRLNNNVGDDDDEDVVDVLLRVMEGGEVEFPITKDNIKAVINDIFAAGTETSATTIIWAMSEMMKKPSVMAKAQAEVRQALKGKETFDEKDLETLTYLKLVIKETFRLHPPLPLLLPRESSQETMIKGYIIPPKTKAIINVWAIGRDPDTWEDPERFMPERFENRNVDFMGNQFELIPFGAGRRMCPGVSFGLTSVVHSLAGLLYHFDWELPSGVSHEDLSMSESMGLIASKKDDLCLIGKPIIYPLLP